MDKHNEKNWTAADWHPEDEDLLMSLDGELDAKDSQTVRSHLDSCWSCRRRAETLQSGISAFIDYHETVLTPLVKSSPDAWKDFGNRLQKASKETVNQVSWFRLLINRISNFQLNFDSPALVRSAIACILVVALVSAFLFFGREQTVSASEILEKSRQNHELEAGAVLQPIVYQKVSLKKFVNGAEAETLKLESWSDKLRFRSRMALADDSSRKFIAEKIVFGKKPKDDFTETLPPQVLLELKEILQKNRMDTVQPLSANSFANWRGGANLQAETVEKSFSADGAEILTIRSTAMQPVENNSISNAEFIVRTRDWHPVKLSFAVQNEMRQSYEFVETGFEIVSLANLNPNILLPAENLDTANTSPGANSSPAASETREKTVEANTAVNADSTLAKNILPASEKSEKNASATTEQELEVMRILQEAKADLGEQISVERGADGRIYVNGIVESAERKNELSGKLQSVADSKTVRINIRTVSEAVAQQRQNPKPKSNAPPEELSVTVDDETQDFAPELRRVFSKEQDIRRFTSQMVSRSRQTMSHAFALKNLTNQFKADKVQNLSPQARAKWLSLIKARANSYRAEAENLRGELQKVFGNSGSGKPFAINGDAELFRAVEKLFALASNNDRAIRSAFSSGGTSSVAAIRSAQFWQSLADAEALAASIAAAN